MELFDTHNYFLRFDLIFLKGSCAMHFIISGRGFDNKVINQSQMPSAIQNFLESAAGYFQLK